ncbi:MAG: hypothetical protein J5I94_28255 [Phaeodactylibacter sp.]|nr:hypothetical protein [Phaeodactylibacter sp.]
MDTNQPLDLGYEEGLHLSADAMENLRITAGWAQFLAILGFIGIGFLILAGIVVGITFSFSSELGGIYPFPPALLSLFYIVIGVLYLFPILYLYRFATQMKTAVQQKAQDSLNRALANLKAHYKFIGILAIVMIGLYFIALIGVMTMGASMF